ncbi:MAG: hypothetical protein GY747_09105 [Planctomycetes bacterium]|nr:hypothetical protein [Planctomycetota bacterium]MCP4770426.1 hypothetical protein [Planctomycetota bacterium]MCP4862233.1 hypothetical protein [Planctomycetota bacterium]
MRKRALLTALLLPACSYLPQAHGDFVNTPYISRTVGAGVVGEGELEVEGLADIDPGEKAKSTLKVNAGLGPGLEFALGFGPYYSAGSGPDSHGVGDVTVTAKYKYADGTQGRPHGIVELETRLPTSDTGPSGRKGETDALVATSLGQAFGDYSLVGTYELGLLGDDSSDSVVIEHAGVLAVSFRLSPEVRAFTEASMVHEPRASHTEWFGGGGAGWTVSDGLELQGAVQFGLNDEAPDYLLVFGFAYELGPVFPVMRGSGL